MSVPSDASRRELLKVVGAGAAGAAILGATVRPVAPGVAVPVRTAPEAERADEVSELFRDLAGTSVGGYRIISVGALERGGIPVILATSTNDQFRVDVLRVDPADGPTGIGAAGSVSVYLRNGGDGRTATNEERGLGAMALAEELLRRDRSGMRPPTQLLTRGEREALDAARIT